MVSQHDSYDTENQMLDGEKMQQMVFGSLITQSIIYVAAKLGIADLLKDGAKSCQELAQSTEADPDSLYRVMRALCSIGIFTEIENRCFQLTPMAEYLRSAVPGSLRAMAIMYGCESWRWQPWGNILYSVKTGKQAFDHVFGMPIFSYLAQQPEAGAIFDACMTSFTSSYINSLISSYDFSSIHTLIDVGGGNGTLMAAILQKYPTVKGVVYEQEQVAEGAKKYLEARELDGRWQVMAGNFFANVPSGGDAYIMKHIIHDWDDESCIKILQNCRNVMPDNGKVLVVENVIGNINEPSPGKFLDLEMLIMTSGGRERTATEFQELFAAAGLQLTNIIPTGSQVSVLECVKG